VGGIKTLKGGGSMGRACRSEKKVVRYLPGKDKGNCTEVRFFKRRPRMTKRRRGRKAESSRVDDRPEGIPEANREKSEEQRPVPLEQRTFWKEKPT